MEAQLDEKTVLKQVADTITSKAITFEIDIRERTIFGRVKEKKKSFVIRPLTPSQLQRISKLIIDIDIKDISVATVFHVLRDHARTCAEIVAIAVSESREHPSDELIDLFFHNLDQADMDTALKIVLQQMEVVNFINTIVSIKSLNVLERRPVGAQNAGKNEASPIVPGNLSAVS
jgi:hypothetical protein